MNINSLVLNHFNEKESFIYENYTPQELEQQSISNQKYNLKIIKEDMDLKLIFEVPREYSHSNYLEFTFPISDLDELNDEPIVGILEGPKNMNFSDFDQSIKICKSSGSLTYENGIDFNFILSDNSTEYNLYEPTGMLGSRIALSKINKR